MATAQTHLSNQYYDICIRRTRGSCSLCFSPEITSTTTSVAASYGVGGSATGPAQQSAVGSSCSGVTTINPAAPAQSGKGDYLEIAGLLDGTGPSSALGSVVVERICGVYWDATAGGAQTSHQTACTYSTPFKVGVHFDNDEAICAPGAAASPDLDKCENGAIATNSGRGYQGFYLAYWQNTC